MAADIKIISYESSQKEAVATVLAAAFGDSVRYYRDYLADPPNLPTNRSAAYVACEGEKPVGYIRCLLNSADEASISRLAVADQFRKHGTGQALVEKAEDLMAREWLRGEPGRVVLLDYTRYTNPFSRFYARLGYEEYERQGSDVILAKALNVAPAAQKNMSGGMPPLPCVPRTLEY